MTQVTPLPGTQELTEVWYTRCPVPTASGLAYSLGWLGEALASDGLQVGILQTGTATWDKVANIQW